MTPPNPLTELAERVSALTEACRETDREILFATFPKERTAIFDGVKHISTMTGRDGEFWFNPLADRTDCPYYTEDFNDAMKAIPKDHWLQHLGQNLKGWRCLVERQGYSAIVKHAATPALALIEAILRARAALENSHG